MSRKIKQDLLIPREAEELEKTRRSIFVSSPEAEGGFRAIIGPHQVGKSTLRDMWYDRWEKIERVYYISITAASCSSSLMIWKRVATALKNQLGKAGVDSAIGEYISNILNAKNDTDMDEVAVWVEALFKCCSDMERPIHVILVLDEVNRVVSYDRDDKKNFFGILRSLQNESKTCGVSILLLSQIGLADIVADEDNSKGDSEVFSGIIQKYPQIRLRGYNYSDLVKLYHKMRLLEKKKLSDETLGWMHYYCGRFPGLLDFMRSASFEDSLQGIDQCYEAEKERFQEIYEWFAKQLDKIKFLSNDGEISGTNVFLQTFAGPDFDSELELAEWLEELYEKGLVERPAERLGSSEPCHIYDYIEELLPKEVSEQKAEENRNDAFAKKIGYEPVSPHFVEYLQKKIRKDENEDIRRLRIEIRNLEKKMRSLLYETYSNIYRGASPAGTNRTKEEEWEGINDFIEYAVCHDNNGNERNSTQKKFWEGQGGQSGFREHRGSVGHREKVKAAKKYDDFSIMDVLSFINYGELIVWKDHRVEGSTAKCWHAVKQYLSCYQIQGSRYDGDAIKKDFKYLAKARNSFAHDTPDLDFADENERNKLRDICKKIMDSIKRGEETEGGRT